ncbi:hypothetical protein C5S35_10690 [Candidatus Methanophagaceae archaeon]|nr:hypothetical protein C5S35_10690 [Methanophagales archaeon]
MKTKHGVIITNRREIRILIEGDSEEKDEYRHY